ncbi:hypothetical protein CI104_09035 [Citrobacter farmeri]|uniref:Uncharacterized protein n=1 Tax=Citrobacter farmeri TaxID=67824 RepID=A0ACA8DDJ0_9ENTR|nr:hypothetical protein CI104_09035 [Citrobacter farmeri]
MCAKTGLVCHQVKNNCAIIAGWRATSPKDDNVLLLSSRRANTRQLFEVVREGFGGAFRIQDRDRCVR